jgi:hypothetical protein
VSMGSCCRLVFLFCLVPGGWCRMLCWTLFYLVLWSSWTLAMVRSGDLIIVLCGVGAFARMYPDFVWLCWCFINLKQGWGLQFKKKNRLYSL